MRKLLCLLSLGGLLAAHAAASKTDDAKPEVLFRGQFAGFARLAANTNLVFKKAGALPATARLREYAWPKLARTAAGVLAGSTNALDPATVKLFRPLLEDAFQQESFLQVEAVPGKPPEWVLAVQTGEEHANLWSTNLFQILGYLKARPVAAKGADWEARMAGHVARFAKVGKWTLVGNGPVNNLWNTTLAEVKASGRPALAPGETVFTGEANLRLLARRVDWIPIGPWQKAEWTVTPRNQKLRSEVRITGLEDLASATLPAWRLPTNMIDGAALASFTAARGLAPSLGKLPSFRALGVNDFPDQFQLWSLAAAAPIMSYATVPAENATNLMEQVATGLPRLFAVYDLTNHPVGRMVWAPGRTGVVWDGLPLVVPNMRPTANAAGSFLFFGLSPMLSSTNELPAELVNQLTDGGRNLVYYHWESSEMRGQEWPMLSQLLAYARSPYNTSGVPPVGNGTPGHLWLHDASSLLGETVTQAVMDGPRALAFTRSSKLGFTSLEMLALANWLDSSGFPSTGPGILYHPRPDQLVSPASHGTNTPAAKAPTLPAK
ncbi:MAG TPA: hypothetical protein VHH73_03915 [Verrucomicrobiae bacterium]|nr:hypothetical protein [Verrucomicrobiae bacterium]